MSWFAILRLGVINAALGAVVALVTFTLNRVMTVELALPAIVPGLLVALHYAVQLLRPRFGFGGDSTGRRTPWIAGGLAVLCAGGALSALAVALMGTHRLAGLALAIPAYGLVGAGVGAVGTSSLALIAAQVAPARRASAATSFWLLMIVGAVLTAGLCAALLHPFSLVTLLRVSTGIAAAAFLIGLAALTGIETTATPGRAIDRETFRTALAKTWREPDSRRFALFVFVSMLAYSAQELILEPFAGAVFALSPSQSAALTGLHQGGVLSGMLLVAIVGSLAGAGRPGTMRRLTIGGCAASALCLACLACAGLVGPAWPLRASLFALGVANGAFAVSAIGAMLGLAGRGRAGLRMGVWGAAQAIAMGLGGLLGTGLSDVARLSLGTPGAAYAAVFLGQAALFLIAARLAGGVFHDAAPRGLTLTATA
jgi:BCD family chlorophyll transporter-like MFS transporter